MHQYDEESFYLVQTDYQNRWWLFRVDFFFFIVSQNHIIIAMGPSVL